MRQPESPACPMRTTPATSLGYGENPPHPHWPDGARIALQFVLNYEEGAETLRAATATRTPKPSCPRSATRPPSRPGT